MEAVSGMIYKVLKCLEASLLASLFRQHNTEFEPSNLVTTTKPTRRFLSTRGDIYTEKQL